jgi:hypothetical protein
MSNSVATFNIKAIVIESLDGSKKVEVSNSLLSADYFEDILSPCVTMRMQLANSSTLFNLLPLRGGEKVAIEIETSLGSFYLDGDYAMYVFKVSDINPETNREIITLHLVSREGLTNETARCQKKYSGNINDSVEDILKNVLLTKKYKSSNIEKTGNSYSFIGNTKKPFHVLTWLGPKSVPSFNSGGNSGGENTGEAKGTAGFLFYENKDGFNFKSVDALVSKTQSGSSSADDKSITKYYYSQINEANKDINDYKILNYTFEKNIDLMKSLRVGMYVNKTYFYDLYTNTLSQYVYKLKDQIKNKLGGESKIAVSKEFGDSISRIMFRVSDRGVLSEEEVTIDSGRDITDMAKSYSRYNILFTQALNMIVPCNVNLKVGDVIYAEFPKVSRTKEKEADPEQSGNYLIKELRHHFEGNQMITSLKLIRDSYGLYGSNNG